MVTDQDRAQFSARLNSALDDAGVPPKGKGRQSHVARMFSVSQKGARKWLEGEAIPTMTRLAHIATELNVSVEWLLSGRGERAVADETTPYTVSTADASDGSEPPYALDHDVIREILKRIESRRREVKGQALDSDALADAIATLYPVLILEKQRHRHRSRLIDEALDKAAQGKARDDTRSGS